jgi:hypothetical protein
VAECGGRQASSLQIAMPWVSSKRPAWPRLAPSVNGFGMRAASRTSRRNVSAGPSEAHKLPWIDRPEGRSRTKAPESIHLADDIRRHGGNRTAAAREPGIDPGRLFRKPKSLDLDLSGHDDPHSSGAWYCIMQC